MSGSRAPKFRVPAALVSPAALCLIGGICYYFTLDFASEDELNDNIQKEFPDVVRSNREVDDRMREFFRRVNSNDPKEEERMRNLMNKGKGSHYSPKRRHATTQEIQDFGFVPKSTTSSSSSPASTMTQTRASPVETNTHENKIKKAGTVALPGSSGRGVTGEGAGVEEKPPRRRWWFW